MKYTTVCAYWDCRQLSPLCQNKLDKLLHSKVNLLKFETNIVSGIDGLTKNEILSMLKVSDLSDNGRLPAMGPIFAVEKL